MKRLLVPIARAQLAEQVPDSFSLERLDDEIDRSVADRVHERLLLIKCGDHDHLRLRIKRANLA